MTDNSKEYISITAPKEQESMRIDQFLAQTYKSYSRSFFHHLIDQGAVLLNGQSIHKASTLVKAGDTVAFFVPPPLCTPYEAIEHLNVKVVYEGKDFIVLNKPAGLAVHKPSPHTTSPSLTDWLLLHYPSIATVGQPNRPGIVHRLDKDTSGLILVAITPEGYQECIALFKQRAIHKTYVALVEGHPPSQGIIELSIYRHPTHPLKMAWHPYTGRQAVTHYRVQEYLNKHALLELNPITGRTHQLRVHCAALGHPIIGDFLYGKTSLLINRQALHAQGLAFTLHNETYSFFAPPPEDFMNALNKLKT